MSYGFGGSDCHAASYKEDIAILLSLMEEHSLRLESGRESHGCDERNTTTAGLGA